MLNFLAEQPLIALFIIMAVGLAFGKIKAWGVSLGAAAAMFVALGLSTANPDIALPPLIYQFGLALFVYVIGLNFGATFFKDFVNRGWKLSLMTIAMMFTLAGLTYAAIEIFNLDPAIGVGTLAGATSSTPGMAAIVEAIGGETTPVVGYSLAYPGAVIGTILVGAIGMGVLRVNHLKDAQDEGMISAPLEWKAVRIDKEIDGTVADIAEITGERIVATRNLDNSQQHTLAEPELKLSKGRMLMINGDEEAVNRAIAKLGTEIEMTLDEDAGLIYTRVTLSNPEIAGMRVSDIDTVKHGFKIARVRSGDQDRVPDKDMVLNLSDRIRVVTTPDNLENVKKFLGNSERSLGNVDLFPFAVGLLAGLLLGAIPIPIPGGTTLNLGFGGGPIVMGLILGAVGRSGPINWQLPFHARQTLSTLGLVLFLSGVGTSAGGSFREAISDPASLIYIAVGLGLTLFSAIGLVVAGMMLFKLKFDEAIGVAAGLTTNPAVMAYLNPQTGTQLAERGYATVYPTTMIGKILMCQILALLVV